jgi:hypothetical protein
MAELTLIDATASTQIITEAERNRGDTGCSFTSFAIVQHVLSRQFPGQYRRRRQAG